MSDTPTVTYWIPLDRLDADGAKFAGPPDGHRAEVLITRKAWEDLGRPGMIEVEPKPSERNFR